MANLQQGRPNGILPEFLINILKIRRASRASHLTSVSQAWDPLRLIECELQAPWAKTANYYNANASI